MYDFGALLHELRKSKGWTQEQLAKMLHITNANVSSYENNINKPTPDTIVQLAHIFGVTTDYLLGKETQKSLPLKGLTEKQIDILTTTATEFRALNQFKK